MTKPPDHYDFGVYEPWYVITAWGLGYELGCVLKYVSRAGRKGPALDDLVKARNYLDRAIDLLAAKQPAEADSRCV